MKEFESILSLMRYAPPETRAEVGPVINKLKLVLFPIEYVESKGNLYSTFSLLKNAIRSSEAVKNRYHIFPKDRPMNLQIGWECLETGEYWKIRLSALRRGIQEDHELCKLLSDADGRELWANRLTA